VSENEGGNLLVCACNLVAERDAYLLVRESKSSARSRYNLPAGKLEVGETLVEAAERECREETGLVVRVESLVGIYQCPRTSEGFAVVNFVFASEPIAGLVESSARHPEVAYFSRAEIAELGRKRMLRGAHIERAIDAFEAGIELPVSLLGVVEASPLPAVEP
jgi:ADP-ribose pyrophosphatase YjhB (NUDIX family)